MEPTSSTFLSPQELVRHIWAQRKLWLATTVVCGVLAAAFSLVMPRYWDAYQGLVVRQETAGSAATRPGKFADLYEMKTLQETILELAKSQQVVAATLEAVDRDTGAAPTSPTLEDVDKFRKRLKMLPPDGGEFGKTEVFYFSVKDPSRDRAIKLVGELCRQLDAALKNLRGERAQNLIAELDQESRLAGETLAAETQRLVVFETHVGADLGELRMLHSANAGQSDLRMEVVQLEADARKYRTQVDEGKKLLELLRAAERDPQQFVATPNSLLTTQPALRRLKDGLVDAQLATSKLGGTRSVDHPQVRAAIEAERQIREDLHGELVTAIRGAEVEWQLSSARLVAAQEQLEGLTGRLNRLAELRAEYSNRVAAVEDCRRTLDNARQNLSTAKAAKAAASSGSLVTRLDEPETGPYPAGIGRTAITAAGGVAGLMLGLGLVVLLAPAAAAGESLPQVAAPVGARRPLEPSPAPTSPSAERRNSAPVAVEKATVAAPAPAAPVASPRGRRESLPKSPGALPSTPGTLPVSAAGGVLGGLSLQEALQAAARQVTS
jgi:uncharacterized protein involved in exopolysaccharide biosynthesis